MRTKGIIPFLLLIASSAMYGQTLRGYVVVQNQKNTPAAPFTVRSLDGGATDATVWNTDGEFSLFFDKKAPGYPVRLDVIKQDYEVVNKNSLRLTLPESPDVQRPLKIYICRKGEWQRNADSLFQINYRQIADRQEKRLAALDARYRSTQMSLEAYNRELDDLGRQLKLMIEEAGRLALLFATANLDDESARFRRAAEYFAKGQIDSVLIALPEKDLLRDLEYARQQIREGRMLEQISAENLELAQQAQDSVLKRGNLLTALQHTMALDSLPYRVAGDVLDDATGVPLPGARIVIGAWRGVADGNGKFETMLVLPTTFRKGRATAQATGYREESRTFSKSNAGRLKFYLRQQE